MPSLDRSVLRARLAGLLCVAAVAACGGADSIADASDLSGAAAGFGGSFKPTHAPYGGFGGASGCKAVRTPVVLLHGNGESASDWLRPDSHGGPSVPEVLRAAGYSACEVFAVTWLPEQGRSSTQSHVHDAAEADQVAGFLADVRAYTGAAQLDLVGHSMGATVGLHALERGKLWSTVRRFVSIAGGLRGVANCIPWGYANPAVPACWAQSVADPDLFGFYPTLNPRMEAGGFRDRPAQHAAIRFASIGAGQSDEILCPGCGSGLFTAAANVSAQLDVGVGSPQLGNHDDTSGVGHYRARRDTGSILVNLLTTSCTGLTCCAGYAGVCKAAE